MKKYYASLVGPLRGIYFPLPDELETELQRRVALQTSKLNKLWCAIYNKADTKQLVKEFGGVILPDSNAMMLDYDPAAVEKGTNHE